MGEECQTYPLPQLFFSRLIQKMQPKFLQEFFTNLSTFKIFPYVRRQMILDKSYSTVKQIVNIK